MGSPYINRFLQPDTLIPDLSNPQSWNRFSYTLNNPVRYNDPTGHMIENEDDGGTTGCYPGELACQLKKDGYEPKPKEEIASDQRRERPVSGVHAGFSLQGGFIKDKGFYMQRDFLMDWKTGNFYDMFTVGVFDAIGTPTGGELTVYGGTSVVHGIPLYGQKDISNYLAGKNIDLAISIGADGLGQIIGTKGLSVDVGDSLKPVSTGAGLLGYQYTTENTLEVGGNLVPNGIEVSGEGGISNSWITSIKSLPWWPFP